MRLPWANGCRLCDRYVWRRKSTALRELGRRGFETVDTDYGSWCHEKDGEVLWDEPRMALFLAAERAGVLFLSGTVSNQGRFYDKFDAVVLLTIAEDLLFRRLAVRSTNDYGKSEAERQVVSRHLLTFLPLLRKSSTHEINTDCSIDDVADLLIRIAASPERN